MEKEYETSNEVFPYILQLAFFEVFPVTHMWGQKMYYVRDHLLRKALNTFEASPYFLSWWRGTHTIKTLKKFLDVKHWNLESFFSYLYCLAAWRGSEALVIPLPTIRISAPLSRIALLGLTYRWSPPEPQRVRFEKLKANQRLIKEKPLTVLRSRKVNTRG